jgi:molybdopterin converting factor small subunit
MKIKVEFSGALRRKFKDHWLELELEETKSIRQIILDLGCQQEEMRYLVAIVNGERVEFSSQVKEGDHVKILLPIGGG